MSEEELMSFEILGTTPTNSYTGSSVSSVRPAPNSNPFIEPEMARMRLSSGQNSPLSSAVNVNSNKDVALDVLLRRKAPSAEMMRLPSLNAEFPSLSNAQLTEEDFNKLHLIIAEHQQLKENLLKANNVIRQYFGAVEKWQSDMKQARDEDRKNVQALTENNQRLQNEVRRLRSELDESVAQAKDTVVMATQSQEVDNVTRELAQLKEETKDMVTRQTYKNVERQCSQLLAENLQFKDVKQQYIDTINCLKVNHASTEELVRMGQADLSAERAARHKLIQELNNVKEENQVLIQQAEIYQKDFIQERDARQRMAGEKDEVLAELNRMRSMLPQTQMSGMSTMANGGYCGLVRYTCPNCFYQFASQQQLSQHLPQCSRH